MRKSKRHHFFQNEVDADIGLEKTKIYPVRKIFKFVAARSYEGTVQLNSSELKTQFNRMFNLGNSNHMRTYFPFYDYGNIDSPLLTSFL